MKMPIKQLWMFSLLMIFIILLLLNSCIKPPETQGANIVPSITLTIRMTDENLITENASKTPIIETSTPENFQTEINNTATVQTTESIVATLTPQPIVVEPIACQSYILFERPGDDTYDTWMIKQDGSDARIIDEGYFAEVWSPSGKYLLLYKPGVLYIANSDGSNPKQVLNLDGVDLSFSTWLTDEILLVEARYVETRYGSVDPHIYYLNLNTGELTKPDPDYQRLIEAISPSGDFWLQSPAGDIEIADLNGTRKAVYIPGGKTGMQPQINPGIAFIPGTNKIIHRGCAGDPMGSGESCHIYETEISIEGIRQSRSLFDFQQNDHIGGFRVSPNGKYLAFTYDTLSTEPQFYILNLDTLDIVYQWPYPYPFNYERFLWSPDSEWLLTPYFNKTSGFDGMAILNIKTGEIKTLTDGKVSDSFWDWRCINITN